LPLACSVSESREEKHVSDQEDTANDTTHNEDVLEEEVLDDIFFNPDNDFTAENAETNSTYTDRDIRLPTPGPDLLEAFDLERFVNETANEFEQPTANHTTDHHGRKDITDFEADQLFDNAVDV